MWEERKRTVADGERILRQSELREPLPHTNVAAVLMNEWSRVGGILFDLTPICGGETQSTHAPAPTTAAAMAAIQLTRRVSNT